MVAQCRQHGGVGQLHLVDILRANQKEIAVFPKPDGGAVPRQCFSRALSGTALPAVSLGHPENLLRRRPIRSPTNEDRPPIPESACGVWASCNWAGPRSWSRCGALIQDPGTSPALARAPRRPRRAVAFARAPTAPAALPPCRTDRVAGERFQGRRKRSATAPVAPPTRAPARFPTGPSSGTEHETCRYDHCYIVICDTSAKERIWISESCS